MTSKALQRPWTRDLNLKQIRFAEARAKQATKSWNDTTTGILAAAKAIAEVHELIESKGGRGHKGGFSDWAKRELKRSRETASMLAVIGARHEKLVNALTSLPPSWGTLYELAKEEDDAVFKRVLRRMSPETTRADVAQLLYETQLELHPPTKKQTTKKKQRRTSAAEEPATPSGKRTGPLARKPNLTPDDAAKRLITRWRLLHKDVQELIDDTKHYNKTLSPEARQFIQNQYFAPIITLLQGVFHEPK